MKLAEALIIRADYNKRIQDIQQRLLRNAKVQEGDAPAEDPNALLPELEQMSTDLETMIQRINRTNSSTQLTDSLTLADALANRDRLQQLHAFYRSLAEAATVTQSRYSKSEVKFTSTVDVAEIQNQANAYGKAHRELDTEIQTLNWNTELLE